MRNLMFCSLKIYKQNSNNLEGKQSISKSRSNQMSCIQNFKKYLRACEQQSPIY